MAGSTSPRDRAVVIAPDLRARGGAERAALEIARNLVDLGYEVWITADGDADLAVIGRYLDVDVSGINRLEVPADGRLIDRLPDALREAAVEARCRRRIVRLAPSVVVNAQHGCEVSSVGNETWAYVHFPHARTFPLRGSVHRAYLTIANRIRRRLASGGVDFVDGFTRVVSNSEFTAANVRRYWGVDSTVLYPSCPPLGHAGADEERERSIVSIGRFQEFRDGVPHKRQDILIEAFSSMTDLHELGWRLRLIGSVGSEAEVCKLRSLAAGLPIDFVLNAPRDTVARICRSSSIYWHAQGYGTDADANPRAQEHFGIAVVEAMSAGLIPVVHDSGGPPEIVAPLGDLAWSDLAGLCESTRAICQMSPAAQHALRERCVARAADFSPAEFARSFAKLVESESDVRTS